MADVEKLRVLLDYDRSARKHGNTVTCSSSTEALAKWVRDNFEALAARRIRCRRGQAHHERRETMDDQPKTETCQTCIYSLRYKNRRHCHHGPPTGDRRWPEVASTDWCGQFRSADEETEEF